MVLTVLTSPFVNSLNLIGSFGGALYRNTTLDEPLSTPTPDKSVANLEASIVLASPHTGLLG